MFLTPFGVQAGESALKADAPFLHDTRAPCQTQTLNLVFFNENCFDLISLRINVEDSGPN
jgi:hypothetical protein